MHDTPTEMIAGELRAIAARQNINGTTLAARLEENPMWVSRRLRAQVEITVADLLRLCDALDVSYGDVIAAALAIPEPVAAS